MAVMIFFFKACATLNQIFCGYYITPPHSVQTFFKDVSCREAETARSESGNRYGRMDDTGGTANFSGNSAPPLPRRF